MSKLGRIALVAMFGTVMVACSGGAKEEPAENSLADKPYRKAMAYIEAKSESEAYGEAYFLYQKGTTDLKVEVQGATPGTHAIHIHEIGDCSSPDGKSAGGHWNPGGMDHGKWGEEAFHLGDIGNIEIASDGTGKLLLTTDKWDIGGGGENDILGKAVIVHVGEDDFTTQPTGNAGGRIGCGVIEVFKK